MSDFVRESRGIGCHFGANVIHQNSLKLIRCKGSLPAKSCYVGEIDVEGIRHRIGLPQIVTRDLTVGQIEKKVVVDIIHRSALIKLHTDRQPQSVQILHSDLEFV